VAYEIGKAQYRGIVRGQIVGDTIGRMKLILDRNTRDLLGVHIIGQDAVELVHIGQAVLSLKGKVDYYVEISTPWAGAIEKHRAVAGLFYP
jgi:NAD(P) transhydrogenase